MCVCCSCCCSSAPGPGSSLASAVARSDRSTHSLLSRRIRDCPWREMRLLLWRFVPVFCHLKRDACPPSPFRESILSGAHNTPRHHFFPCRHFDLPTEDFNEWGPPAAKGTQPHYRSVMSNGQVVFHKEKQTKDGYNLAAQYSAPKSVLGSAVAGEDEEDDPLIDRKARQSKFERESDYQKQRYVRELSPERDPSLADDALAKLREKETELRRKKKEKEIEKLQKESEASTNPETEEDDDGSKTPPRRTRKRRWDVGGDNASSAVTTTETTSKKSRWEKDESTVDGVDSQKNTLSGYMPPEESNVSTATKESLIVEIPGVKDLQFFKQQDEKYFGKLLDNKSENQLTIEEVKERKIMKLLLKIKNGTPQARKQAMRQITEGARQFGAKALFNQVLPLLLEKSLEDQERHLLVKVIDRVLYKLDDMVRPYTHKILVVVSPLLIDEDYVTRIEGREIISNVSKAAGLAHMISTIRPDIDHSDEYVRNTTSRSLAVVASALGIQSLIPFLRAVCKSKKSWQARHTGIKTIQQIAILVGCGVLPHLEKLVECVSEGLTDDQLSVRIMTANALSSLAEASAPYGIESFELILEPLWGGMRKHRGRGLASMLRCIGNIIPLMEPEYAAHYTREVMRIVLREFSSPDEDMKKTVLRVVQQCSATEGVEPAYLKKEVLPSLFKNFWVRRMALDRRSSRIVIDTTVVLSENCGVPDIVERLLNILKDESEPFRRMAVETVEKTINKWGSSGLSERTEERLIDGLLVAYEEQTADPVVLKGLSTVVCSLGVRVKPLLQQILTPILHRLKNKAPEVRQQAADIIGLIAPVIKTCEEDEILSKLSTVLFESLGEAFPEALGSILAALTSIATVVGIGALSPPASKILLHVTPILRNRHEKVQENAIELVGRIADRGAEHAPPKEWMRICFELLDMLKSPRRGIRRATNNTFGYIAKAVGPQDVLVTLLNNLKVQERQLRVCTAVAIGIVAETCSPFTVLPALMNEYRTPETNVQNGVLKAMTFMFEYIGEISSDYVYAVAPLLEDALTDRDQVHRQTAATVVRQIALGCVGAGREDVFIHFLNLLMPNLYETSPHVIARILDGIEGVRTAVGPGLVLNYVWNGLFHPARKVRKPFWKLYNDTYVQQMDAMVPHYPKLEDPKYKLDLFDTVL